MKLIELGINMKFRRLYCILAILSLGACAGVRNFNFRDLFGVENKPVYKIGAPYEIDGKTYYPREDYHYSEIGLASWYGEDFHGSLTANGEVFDMNALTAAHKTLPMPSFVRVTNLTNGKNLVLRVNDRGPFVPGRIIDVSRKAAKILGFSERGVTQVKVEILPEDSLRLKEKMLGIPQDTSDMLDNIGGEGEDFREEEGIGSYQADNAVEYFPLYEDEVDEKRFAPEYKEEVFPEEDLSDVSNEEEQNPSLQQLPDGQAIRVGYRQYVKAYPAQEDVYQTPVQYQEMQGANVIVPYPGYVASGPVEYIPNPYFTYQQPVQEQVLVPVSQPIYDNSGNVNIKQDAYVEDKPVVAKKTASVVASGPYYIQAASYKKESYANELKTKISAKIKDVFVVKADVKGTTYYRVKIGPVIDKDSANAIAGNLHAYGIDNPVISKIK